MLYSAVQDKSVEGVLLKLVEPERRDLYPELHQLAAISLTIPMSRAEVEWLFSTMKRVVVYQWILKRTKYLRLLYQQGKSDGFDSCDRPSDLTQIGFKSSIFRPCDIEIW